MQRDEDRASRARWYAMQQWPLTAIEEAVERDVALILPPALRTRNFTVRLPRYQIGAFKVLAEDGRELVEALLMRMSEELTDLHYERLTRVIPCLGERWRGPRRAGKASAALSNQTTVP